MLLLLTLFFSAGQALAQVHQHDSSPIKKPIQNLGEKSKLQKLIDATEPGGTLYLEGRIYRGSIVITKPITIIGTKDTKIQSLTTALTVMDTKNVQLQNISLQADDTVLVASNVDSLSLQTIVIADSLAGIQITDSQNITLQDVTITGRDGHFSTKGHGVAIYEGKNVKATRTSISNVMDGFYLEGVNGITLKNNAINKSRYAVHMMYSDNVVLTDNTLYNNMTGFMVMIAKNVRIENNLVEKNNTLNSLGVYAYDVENVTFKGNNLRENTTAMDIQNARDMKLVNNVFATNGTVLQVKRSAELLVTQNQFYGNILTVRTDPAGVRLQRNFYDDYTGKDYDGDGLGDTSYIATNSFGQWMVRKPVYQYFMESPSVVTLNKMDTEVAGNTALVIADEEPLVVNKPIALQLDIKSWQLLLSSAVIIGLLIVRRRLH